MPIVYFSLCNDAPENEFSLNSNSGEIPSGKKNERSFGHRNSDVDGILFWAQRVDGGFDSESRTSLLLKKKRAPIVALPSRVHKGNGLVLRIGKRKLNCRCFFADARLRHSHYGLNRRCVLTNFRFSLLLSEVSGLLATMGPLINLF